MTNYSYVYVIWCGSTSALSFFELFKLGVYSFRDQYYLLVTSESSKSSVEVTSTLDK